MKPNAIFIERPRTPARAGIAAIRAAAASVYQPGQHCPSCLSNNWLIGRTTAECARCGHATALDARLDQGALS